MKRFRLNLDLTGVIVVIAAGVMIPVMLLTAVGIVAVTASNYTGGIVTGILVICFAVTAAGSALVAIVMASRKARLARMQADFTANMSHEFRTPLSSIKLYAQTLQSGKLADDPKRTAECIGVILREAGWLDVMIDRLLTWRSSSKELMQLNMEPAPVTKAVSAAVEQFKYIVPPEEIQLSFSPESTLCVMHDTSAISTIVLNLLVNAYKYTGDGKKISVRTRDEEDRVVIEVEDNGIGIEPSEMQKIYEPFYRVKRKNGIAPGGTGLGLSIVRHLASRHNGTIEVKSEKDKGSVFFINLPATEKTE
ncbi:MAG: hypothetical protein A2283_23345 [Lentisphaerae bacterium RIFOXYA12_FULL_48_11]|nr:MAG: hypothetical protein A2283_23345 [Lentisphaerae bacterium RIFOXYA12_FULL_48_11]